MYVTQEELEKKIPVEILQENKEYLVDKIQVSTHGVNHNIQKIRVIGMAKNDFKIQSEQNGIFWFDKKWVINIIENL